jgi:hypothetical protein
MLLFHLRNFLRVICRVDPAAVKHRLDAALPNLALQLVKDRPNSYEIAEQARVVR